MIEVPRNITGSFKATENNFIGVCRSMILETMNETASVANNIHGEVSIALSTIQNQMKFPMAETAAEENADLIHKFLNEHKMDAEKIVQLGMQLKSIYDMLYSYASGTMRKPPAATPQTFPVVTE